MNNMIGRTFTHWKVLAQAESKKYRKYFLCRCDCGTEKDVDYYSLINETSTSCGCHRKLLHTDMSIFGKKFNMLKAENPSDERDVNGQVLWNCICDCGNTTKATTTQLKNNYKISCGCIRPNSIRTGYEESRIDNVFVPALTQKIGKGNRTGIKGVHMDKRTGKYEASLCVNGQKYRKGGFNTVEEAAKYRKELEEVYHKPFIEALKEKRNGPNNSISPLSNQD